MNTVISEGINLTPEDHLYILGDMIDRGQDGIRILQDVSSRPNVTCLLGNHEYMMWNYVSRHIFKDLNWLNPSNGGMQTLSEYRKLMPADRASVKKYHAELFLQIELTVEGTTFLLSHSSFLPGYGTVKWRDKSITQRYRTDNRYHIIGHVPVMMIDDRYWQDNCMPEMPAFYQDPLNWIINIDLGCAMIPIIKANPDRFEDSFKKVPSLCVLNLENFAKGIELVATYIRGIV